MTTFGQQVAGSKVASNSQVASRSSKPQAASRKQQAASSKQVASRNSPAGDDLRCGDLLGARSGESRNVIDPGPERDAATCRPYSDWLRLPPEPGELPPGGRDPVLLPPGEPRRLPPPGEPRWLPPPGEPLCDGRANDCSARSSRACSACSMISMPLARTSGSDT